MRWKSINTPLGQCDCPFGVSKKCSGTPIFGDMFDWWNNAETNDYNLMIARETNEANAKINQEQLALAREQYESEKAENRFLVDQAYERELENRKYNSPEEMKKRYLAAGINPYLAMSQGGGAGSHSVVNPSVGQNPHANQPNMIPMQIGAPMQPYKGFGQGISNSLSLAIEKMNADTERQKVENDMTAHINDMELRVQELMEKKRMNTEEIKTMRDTIQNERDKISQYERLSKLSLEIDARNAAVNEFNAAIAVAAMENNVRMTDAQINYLSGILVNASRELDIRELEANNYGAYLGNAAIHMINEDAATFESLGFEKELLPSKKWSNIINSAVSVGQDALLWYLTVRSGFRPKSIKGFSRP